MKIYCLYGHGKETERSYWYMQGEYEQDETRSDAVDESGYVRISNFFPASLYCPISPLHSSPSIPSDLTERIENPEEFGVFWS